MLTAGFDIFCWFVLFDVLFYMTLLVVKIADLPSIYIESVEWMNELRWGDSL